MRVISPLVGAFVVIMIVTLGLSVLDVTLAITLGGIMLLTLFIMPPVFYRAGKNTGQNLTHLRGQYRQQLTSWLQGQAELTIFGASKRYRAQMEATELQWHEAQRRQSELTALSQALMLLIGALAVMLMLWMASGGVGGNTQPGALIALFVFCALAAFEALAPVTGAFQHLGQVIASALRITELTEQKPEVTFPQTESLAPERSHSPCGTFRFVIPTSRLMRSMPSHYRLILASMSLFWGVPAAENQRCCSYSPAPGTRNKAKFCSTIFRYPR